MCCSGGAPEAQGGAFVGVTRLASCGVDTAGRPESHGLPALSSVVPTSGVLGSADCGGDLAGHGAGFTLCTVGGGGAMVAAWLTEPGKTGGGEGLGFAADAGLAVVSGELRF